MSENDPSNTDPNAREQAITDLLAECVAELKGDVQEQYRQWATQVAPLVTAYAARAASGDAIAQASLRHIRAQAVGRANVLRIATETRTLDMLSQIIATVAITAAKGLI